MYITDFRNRQSSDVPTSIARAVSELVADIPPEAWKH